MSDTEQKSPDPITPVPEGAMIANPAEPAAPTMAPAKPDNSSLVTKGTALAGYPKVKYHPVHGRVPVADPNEEASLSPPTDYFDTPEEADMHRTATEAWTTHAANINAKLEAHADAGHQVVRNSVQADESLRKGNPEPL